MDTDENEPTDDDVRDGCVQVGTGGQHSRLYYDGYPCSWCGARKPAERAPDGRK